MVLPNTMSHGVPTTYVATHSETAWSRSGQHAGQTDLPLTEPGRHNASRFSDRLRSMTFAKVYEPPAARCVHKQAGVLTDPPL